MTRKDFQLIADALKESKPEAEKKFHNQTAYMTQFMITCHCMADALATTNPRFDRDRFLTACGYFKISLDKKAQH